MTREEDMPAITAPETVVREAALADLDAVIDVLLAANTQFADVLPRALYDAYMANVLDVVGRMADAQLLVAEFDGRVAGAVTFYPDASREGWDWPAHWAGIRTVAVAPSARGRRIGRDLGRACIDLARAGGAEAVCLHTAAFMSAAVAMYEGLGFQRLPAFDRDVSSLFALDDDGSRLSAIAYWLDLTTGSAS